MKKKMIKIIFIVMILLIMILLIIIVLIMIIIIMIIIIIIVIIIIIILILTGMFPIVLFQCVRLLADCGCALDITDNAGLTAADLASKCWHDSSAATLRRRKLIDKVQ